MGKLLAFGPLGAPLVEGLTATPKLPKTPDPLDSEEERKKARLAADRKRTLALGAFGSSDTIKTGPSGPGATPQAFKGNKTLIGT